MLFWAYTLGIPYPEFYNLPLSTIDELICIAQISNGTAKEIEFVISEDEDENYFPTNVR